MRVDIYSDFTLKDILQSYSSIQFSDSAVFYGWRGL